MGPPDRTESADSETSVSTSSHTELDHVLPVPPVPPVPPVFPAVVVVVGGTVVAVVVVVGGSVVVVVVVLGVVVVADAVVVVTDTVVGGAALRIGVIGSGAALAVVPGVAATLVVGRGELVSTCNREPPGNDSVSALLDGAVVVDVDGTTAVVVDTEGTYSWVTGVTVSTGSASVGADVVCRENAANTNVASKHPTKPSVMLRALCGLPSGHG
jgi:hypothetical protein